MRKLILGILIPVLLVGCGSTADILTPETQTLEPETKIEVPETLPYVIEVNTFQYAFIGISLAKGEVLNVRMYISPWDGRGNPGEDFMLQILSQAHRIVFDAGRVEGIYEFSFTSERSGRYLMTFLDDQGHCIVELHHDYEGEFWEYK